MPNADQYKLLLSNTKKQIGPINGVDGMTFTASNGNSIFFPATGFFVGKQLYKAETGNYWTSIASSSQRMYAWDFSFDSVKKESSINSYIERNAGQPVRAITE